MSNTTDLIAKLRERTSFSNTDLRLHKEAADALTAQAATIAEQAAQIESLTIQRDLNIRQCDAYQRQFEALREDEKELAFLAEDLLYWVERAVGKGNANCDIEEAFGRYETWINDRIYPEKRIT